MKSHGAALALPMAIAPLALAKPMSHIDQIKQLLARQEGSWEDMCNKWKLDDSDMSIAADLWDNTGTGAWFDEWLNDHEDHGLWTATMDEEVNNNGESGFSCASISSSCDPPSDCKFHFDQGMGNAYWVLLAASRLHDGLEYMFEELQSATIYNSLELDTMIEKFGPEPSEDINGLSVLTSSMVIAAGLTAPYAPVSAILTIFVGAFGLAAQFTNLDPPDPTAPMRQQLGKSFENAQKSIETMTATIYGGKSDMPVENLPGQTQNFGNALARFFADGKFLVEDIQSSLQGVLDNYIHIQQISLAGSLISFYGYVVVADNTRTDADSCHDMNSSWWDEGKGKCFMIMKNREGETGNMPLGVEDGPFTVAMNDYHIDVGEFFHIAWTCAENHPDGDGKLPDNPYDIPTDGSKPDCFYNVGVVEGDVVWNDSGYAYIGNIGLNTAGVSENAAPPNFPDARDS